MKNLRRWYTSYVRTTPDSEPVKIELHGDLSRVMDVLGKQAIHNRSGKAHVLSGLIVARIVKTKKART